jgi:hypothetical protein
VTAAQQARAAGVVAVAVGVLTAVAARGLGPISASLLAALFLLAVVAPTTVAIRRRVRP